MNISKQINSKIIGFLLYQYDWHELLLKFTSNSHCTAFSSSKFGRNRMGESESNSRRTYRQILKYLTQPFFAPMQMDAESWSTIKMYASFWMWVLLLWSSYNICLSEISRFIVAENKLKKKKWMKWKLTSQVVFASVFATFIATCVVLLKSINGIKRWYIS